jgi:hypothetical protein
MTYGEFLEYVSSKCLHETIYTDSDGHPILVIRLLDAYGMVNKLQRPWVGLTKEQMLEILKEIDPEAQRLPIGFRLFADAIEAKLKEKNT